MNNLEKYNNFVAETRECENLLELEYAADYFDKGIVKGIYSNRQSKDFNSVYWELKDQLICDSIKSEFNGFNKLDLLSMVKSSPIKLKGDRDELVYYIKGIVKNLRTKQKIA